MDVRVEGQRCFEQIVPAARDGAKPVGPCTDNPVDLVGGSEDFPTACGGFILALVELPVALIRFKVPVQAVVEDRRRSWNPCQDGCVRLRKGAAHVGLGIRLINGTMAIAADSRTYVAAEDARILAAFFTDLYLTLALAKQGESEPKNHRRGKSDDDPMMDRQTRREASA